MRKALTYTSVLVTGVLVIMLFVTAKNYTQLGIAVVLYPAVAYYAFKILRSRKWAEPVITISLPERQTQEVAEVTAEPEKEQKGVTDFDKRDFLKFIGAAGLSFFLFSIFRRKTDAIFPGSASAPGLTALEDASGNKIDPAVRQPMEGFQIAEIDDSIVAYYGFTDKNGSWVIMTEDTDASSFRYAKGDSGFPDKWASRDKLNYDYFFNVF